MINLANSDNVLLKTKVLSHFTILIEQLFNSTSSSSTNKNDTHSLTPSEPPSLFVINSLFKLNRVNLKDFYYGLQEDFQKIGSQIGFELLKN